MFCTGECCSYNVYQDNGSLGIELINRKKYTYLSHDIHNHGYEHLTLSAMFASKLGTRGRAVNALAWFGSGYMARPP